MKSAIVARLDLRCGLGWCLKLHKGRLKKNNRFSNDISAYFDCYNVTY